MSHSQACLYEQKGRSHRASGETEEFTKCFEEAITLFLEIGLSPEAASCYEGLGRLDKVAGSLSNTLFYFSVRILLICFTEIWKDCGQYEKAASFYEKGNFFVRASDCYHSCSRYEEAIEVLRRGDCFDELVNYASRYAYDISFLLNALYSLSLDIGGISARLLCPDIRDFATFS